MKDEYRAWLQWLKKESGVENDAKRDELHRLDEKGWSALHYAAREYCADILSAALEVKGGKWTIREHSDLCIV